MPNYLLKILQNYFDEILVLEGNVSITESLLKAKANEIITENRRHKNIIDAITSYSNITSIKVPPNSGNPNFIYSITTDDLEERIVDIHSQQCCYTVSQAYEIFENFLIEIISEFLFHNQPFLKVLKVSEGIVLISKDTIKSLITNNKIKKSNNKGLLWMVRKISPDFKRNESHNLLNENHNGQFQKKLFFQMNYYVLWQYEEGFLYLVFYFGQWLHKPLH